MMNLYERISMLCEERSIDITTMCKESGAARGSLTDLKMGRIETLSAKTLGRIAEYFGVPVDFLLDNGTEGSVERVSEKEKALLHSYRTMSEKQERTIDARRELSERLLNNPELPSGSRLELLFDKLDYDPEIISFNLEITPSFINNWINSNDLPPRPVVDKILRLLQMDASDLLNSEELMVYQSEGAEWALPKAANILPFPSVHDVPRLGRIACGEPITAEENIEGYDAVPDYVKADFTLVCKGDSMINARIYDGDVVCISQKAEVHSGDIAAVLVDGDEATLKRIRIFEDHIVLEPENPTYRPMTFWDADMNRIRVIGKATHFISAVR